MLKEWQVIIVLAVLAIASTASADDERGKRLIMDFVNNVITLEGSFQQSLTDADGVVLERTSGTLEIARPGQFRWSYVEPYEQWLIADGLNIWSYDLDLEQVTVKPQVEALANTPAMLLGGSAEALEQFSYGGTTVETETTWVRLEPKDQHSGFVGVEMGFVDGELRRMIFFDHLEQTTYVALENVKVNEPINATRFEFEVPDDVDVVGVPATAAIP